LAVKPIKIVKGYKMKAQDLAKELNGSEYPLYPSSEVIKKCKDNGLVIVFGHSDDLMEFIGAIMDEIDVTSGSAVATIADGKVSKKEGELLKDEAFIIPAWCDSDSDYDWSYKTNIPHHKFDIFDGDEKYCQGMVFSVNDALGVSNNE